MLVHQSQAGCIIGKGGLKIKELREVSHFPDNYALNDITLVPFFFLLFLLVLDEQLSLALLPRGVTAFEESRTSGKSRDDVR